MNFVFRMTPEVLFGPGTVDRAAEKAAQFGRRVLLVTGAASLERTGVLGRIEQGLAAAGCTAVRWTVSHEPDVALADEGARLCRAEGCEVVLAVGGGSVLDAGKAVAALATNEGSALDYLEDVPVGGGRSVTARPLPLICVPTTAGTGSEVTRNAVLKIPAFALKRSMRSDLMVPRVAVVDPTLLHSAPLPVAAAAGMDALTHLLEAYTSRNATPMTDAVALPGIRLAVGALRAMAKGRVTDSTWEEISLASLWGGIALANAGLGAVHGLVAPLGGLVDIPHGAGCACLLPATFRINVAALTDRAPESAALARFTEVAAIIGEGQAAEALEELRRQLGVPPLRSYGQVDVAKVIAGARGSSMRTNPIVLTDDELRQIMTETLSA